MKKYFCINVEGIDKAGKQQILDYLKYLGKCEYVLMDRGIMSNITYSRIYNRNYEYDVSQFKNWVFVYLVCDKDDWDIRCKLTNEPKIDYGYQLDEFNKTFYDFQNKGFKIMFLNTSHITPYDAALKILDYMNKLNEGNK